MILPNPTIPEIVPPKLPAITFIHGPQPLATEVANILSDICPGMMAHSFEEPLRNAANGLFFYSDPSIDIGGKLQERTPIPSRDHMEITFETFIRRLHSQLQIMYGEDVLGALAVRLIQDNIDYFGRSVFADASPSRMDDMRRIIKAFDADNCLIVNLLGVEPMQGREVYHINIASNDPIEIVQELAKVVVAQPAKD